MLRKTTSLILFLSAVLVTATSVVLYVTPEGRVAFWADWRFAGLSKSQWGDVHVTTGFLFLVAMLVHMYLNWKAAWAYCRARWGENLPVSRALLTAVAVVLFVTVGTFYDLPPMRQVLHLAEMVKTRHARVYGNPPFGHAELSTLRNFMAYLGVEEERGLAALRGQGLAVPGSDKTLREVARANHVSPQRLYDILRRGAGMPLPQTPPEGFRQMPLADFAAEYGLDPEELVVMLASQGIQASPRSTFGEMAEASDREPAAIYALLRASVKGDRPVEGNPVTGVSGPGQEPRIEGLGRMTLKEACAAAGLDCAKAQAFLKARKVKARESSNMKELAAELGKTPHDLLEELR